MKIAILNWRDLKHPRAGGAEVRLHEIYGRLAAQGHEVLLISSAFAGAQSSEWVDGIRVERMGSDATHLALVWTKGRKIIREFAPDLLIEDLNKLPYYSSIWWHGPHLIQMHHLWGRSIFKESSLLAAAIVWGSEQTIPWIYRKPKFCVVSQSTQSELQALGIAQKRISVIHNGTALDRLAPSGSEPEKFVLWLGRLQKYKGILDALDGFEAFSKSCPDYRLKIAGSGPFLSAVQERVQASTWLCDRVDLLGFVSSEERLALYQSADFLLQSSYKEGWGLTVVEANACGTPVVAQNAPGLCDSVKHGETGLLYDYGSVEAMVQSMLQMANDRALRNRLAQGALAWAKWHSWDRAADETFDLLKMIYGEKP